MRISSLKNELNTTNLIPNIKKAPQKFKSDVDCRLFNSMPSMKLPLEVTYFSV